jgi:hypothetical protein
MEKLNVFKNTLNNKVFLGVIFITIVFQVIMVEGLGKLANTVHLNKEQWLISVLIGSFSLVVAFVVKLPANGNWKIVKQFLEKYWLQCSAVIGLICVLSLSSFLAVYFS